MGPWWLPCAALREVMHFNGAFRIWEQKKGRGAGGEQQQWQNRSKRRLREACRSVATLFAHFSPCQERRLREWAQARHASWLRRQDWTWVKFESGSTKLSKPEGILFYSKRSWGLSFTANRFCFRKLLGLWCDTATELSVEMLARLWSQGSSNWRNYSYLTQKAAKLDGKTPASAF